MRRLSCGGLRLKLIQVSDVREVDINLLLGLLLVAFCALVDNDFVNEGVQDFRRQFGNPGELFARVMNTFCKNRSLPQNAS